MEGVFGWVPSYSRKHKLKLLKALGVSSLLVIGGAIFFGLFAASIVYGDSSSGDAFKAALAGLIMLIVGGIAFLPILGMLIVALCHTAEHVLVHHVLDVGHGPNHGIITTDLEQPSAPVWNENEIQPESAFYAPPAPYPEPEPHAEEKAKYAYEQPVL